MPLNKTIQTTYFSVDSYGMMLRDKEVGGDSIGVTFDAAFTYGIEHFKDALLGCYWNRCIYRHPSKAKEGIFNDCSNDHVSYLVMALRMAGIDIGSGIKWKFSDKFSLSLPLWAYLRGHYFLYYLIQVIQYLLLWPYFKLVYWMSGFEREPNQWVFLNSSPYTRSAWDKFFTEIMYPRIYTLYNHSFQVYFLEPSLGRWILQRLFLSLAPRHNYVIKLLNGGKVDSNEVFNYEAMTSDRWTGSFVRERNDRPFKLTGDEFNTIDVDLLKKINSNPNNRINYETQTNSC
jgi:hypothetical protein